MLALNRANRSSGVANAVYGSGLGGAGAGFGAAVADAAGRGLGAPFGGGRLVKGRTAASGGVCGAAGAAWPRATESPNSRHWPSTGANSISKLICAGTEGKNPAIRIMPFASISGSTVSCGSMAATTDKSSFSLRCFAKISARRAALWTTSRPSVTGLLRRGHRGIGFIGAGAIIRQGESTTGHATAASIWTVGIMGAAV
jgi:hypothetical protein